MIVLMNWQFSLKIPFFFLVCSNRLIEKYVMHEKRDNVFFLRQTQEPCCASRHQEVIADFYHPHPSSSQLGFKAFLGVCEGHWLNCCFQPVGMPSVSLWHTQAMLMLLLDSVLFPSREMLIEKERGRERQHTLATIARKQISLELSIRKITHFLGWRKICLCKEHYCL